MISSTMKTCITLNEMDCYWLWIRKQKNMFIDLMCSESRDVVYYITIQALICINTYLYVGFLDYKKVIMKLMFILVGNIFNI